MLTPLATNPIKTLPWGRGQGAGVIGDDAVLTMTVRQGIGNNRSFVWSLFSAIQAHNALAKLKTILPSRGPSRTPRSPKLNLPIFLLTQTIHQLPTAQGEEVKTRNKPGRPGPHLAFDKKLDWQKVRLSPIRFGS